MAMGIDFLVHAALHDQPTLHDLQLLSFGRPTWTAALAVHAGRRRYFRRELIDLHERHRLALGNLLHQHVHAAKEQRITVSMDDGDLNSLGRNSNDLYFDPHIQADVIKRNYTGRWSSNATVCIVGRFVYMCRSQANSYHTKSGLLLRRSRLLVNQLCL